MVALSATLFLMVISAGAAAVGFLSIIAGVVGFSDPSWYHNDTIGVEFAVKIDTVGQEVWTWIRAPWPMYVHVSINNIVKFEDDDGELEGGLTDLLPVGGVTHGKGVVKFEMYSVGDNVMPNLRARPQEIAPQAFVKQTSRFPTFLRYIMILNALILNNWGLVQLGVIAAGIMWILAGAFLIIVGILTRDKNVVQDLRKTKKAEEDNDD